MREPQNSEKAFTAVFRGHQQTINVDKPTRANKWQQYPKI